MVEHAGQRREHVIASAFAGGRPRDPASEARAARELKARVLGTGRDDAGERYRIVRCVGAGGAGDVYEAWDDELRRRVAIKVLRASSFPGDGETQARARLVREAQAIARVAHPNLVAVFDVGTCTPAMREALGNATDGAVFIVMEYVEGRTLAEWIENTRPSLRAIVEVFADAARGLAAAHARGIVHRDFKPRNVMVTEDRRVCVLDFGLARAVPRDGDGGATTRTTVDQDEPLRLDELTEPGMVMGTPPYMAPEQHRGEPTDPRTDQFAFGVSLWEAIFRERPFQGTTLGELRAAMKRAPQPPAIPRVPRWVVAVLRRTLAPAAKDRFASMAFVARELDRGLRSRTRNLALAGIAVVALAGIGIGTQVDRGADCDDARFSGAAREHLPAIMTGFAATPRGDVVLPRVLASTEAYAGALTSAAREVCAAEDEGRRAVAMMCLEDRAARLHATASVLANADATIVQHALELVAELPPVASCARSDTVVSTPVRDPTRAREIMHAAALRSACKYAEAAALAERIADEADAAGDEANLARARVVLGEVALARAGTKPEDAEARFRAALAAAEAAGDDEAAADALTLLVHTVGPVGGRFDEAGLFADQAEAKLARLGDPPERTAALVREIGLLRYRQHAYDEALAMFERALELREALYDADHPSAAMMRVEIGNVLVQLERPDDAKPHFETALASLERAWGPDHDSLAGPLTGLASVARDHGDVDRAVELHERVLTLSVAAHGENHDAVAVAASGLGLALGDAGRDVESLAAQDRALSIRLALLGPDHVAVARTRTNRGSTLVRLGRHAEAIVELQTAVDVFTRAYGPDHEAVGMTLTNLGSALWQTGEREAAIEALTRAVEILDAKGHPSGHAAEALANLATHHIAMGRVAEGRQLLERALARAPAPRVADAIRQELERTAEGG